MTIQNPMELPLPDTLFGGGLVLPYNDFIPNIGQNVFLAPYASVIGDSVIGDRSSIWFGAVVRGDIAAVKVGDETNIQDHSILHVGDDKPCVVGNRVVIGHRAILHGCTIEDECLIGMGAVILNRAVIGKGSIVGASALVTQDTIVPPNSLVLGMPAKAVRELNEDERNSQSNYAKKYVNVAQNYQQYFT